MLRGCVEAGFLLILLLFAQIGQAHEVRPSIFSLKFAPDRSFTLTADTNLEALIAGIGGEHEDTDSAPTAQDYNRMRALAPADKTNTANAVMDRAG